MTEDLGLFGDRADENTLARSGSAGERRRRRQARERRRRRRRRMVLGTALVVVVLAIAGVLLGSRALHKWREVPDFAGSGDSRTVVEVEAGQSLTEIGATLAQHNVVASVAAFTRAADADPRARAVQPGFYQLRERMSGASAVAMLQEPEARVGRLEIRGGEQLDNVRLPDGKAVPGLYAEISRASCAMIGDKSTCVSVEDLRATVEQSDPRQLGAPDWALDAMSRIEAHRRLEGLLVPGTYDVRPGSSARALLQQVMATSLGRLSADGFPASTGGAGRSPYDVLVIASVIEREAITSDFRRVSRVIYNRLAARMPLQMDSTINYPLDRQEARTSDTDRARPGPYNTYINVELPVSPIGAPGDAAIAAALNPEPGPWLYFVKCQKDGASCFSVTKEEHDAAVRDAAARGVF